MKKYVKKLTAGLAIFSVISVTAPVVSVAAEAPINQRIASIMSNEKQIKLAFYLDADGHANYEQRVLDEITASIQTKLPMNAKLIGDTQFLANLDLYREEQYSQMLQNLAKDNPAYAVMMAQNGATNKMQLTTDVIQEFLDTTDYDGIVIVRIDKVQEKAGVNYTNAILFGFGGVNTKVEMDVTTRVYNKQKKAYAFNNKQRVVGKVHGTWAPDTASRRAIPMALAKIGTITVE